MRLEFHDVAILFAVEKPRLYRLNVEKGRKTRRYLSWMRTLVFNKARTGGLLTVHVMTISPFLPPYPATSVGETTGAGDMRDN